MKTKQTNQMKLSGKRIIQSTKQNKLFESFCGHKEMGNCSRTGMNNWRRSFTKHARIRIKKETEQAYLETL